MTKNLIVYYSWSQTTAKLARLLQTITGADLVELTVAADTFSPDMSATSAIAEEQLVTGHLPALTNVLPALDHYQTVLVGGPVWSGKVATPVRTFLNQLDQFNGQLAPFYTDAGAGKHYEADFATLTTAKVTAGIELTGQTIVAGQAEVQLQAWWQAINS